IRTPGGVTLNGFQDRRNRPLCHLSLMFAGAKVGIFIEPCKYFVAFIEKNFALLLFSYISF
ncbi:MAG: hypothetical protein K2I09_01045, partial [Duncaniella sp.]|nr:hypothetical protein [Duncaniella sp.]